MPERVRIFVHPGHVRSRSDGDEHFISFPALCQLYGLHPDNRKFREKFEVINAQYGLERGVHRAQKGDIHLAPRTDGNYFKYDG